MVKKKAGRKEAAKNIKDFFEKAENLATKNPESARRYVKKARRIAMAFNLKLPRGIRKKFCRKCYSYFTSKNSKTRIKHGYLVLECLNCRNIQRYKIK